jgi:hypothetical protein
MILRSIPTDGRSVTDMMMETAALYRAAGISAALAVVAFVISAIALTLFFGGAGQIWGPINDVFIALCMIALILPIVAIDRMAEGQAGVWLRVVTVAALAGAVLAASGQILLVVGVIDLQTSYVTGGLGFLPVLVWMMALVVLAGPLDLVPAPIGWLAGAGLVLVMIASVTTVVTMGPPAWLAWAAVVVVFALWIGSLATTFLDQGQA